MTVLIACNAITTQIQGFAGRHMWPDPCLEPEMHARCCVRQVWHGRPTSVMVPRCGHSGVNAAFCTLLNGSGKALREVLAIADAISPPMAGPRVDHG